MAVKHVKEYYEKVCKQYIEMRDNLKEMEELLKCCYYDTEVNF